MKSEGLLQPPQVCDLMNNATATALNFNALSSRYSREFTAFSKILWNDSAREQPSQTLVNRFISSRQNFSVGNSGKTAGNVQSKSSKRLHTLEIQHEEAPARTYYFVYPIYHPDYFRNLEEEVLAPENKNILPRLLTLTENKRGERCE